MRGNAFGTNACAFFAVLFSIVPERRNPAVGGSPFNGRRPAAEHARQLRFRNLSVFLAHVLRLSGLLRAGPRLVFVWQQQRRGGSNAVVIHPLGDDPQLLAP